MKTPTLCVNGERLISELDNSEINSVAFGPTTLITVYLEVTSFKPTDRSEGKCLQMIIVRRFFFNSRDWAKEHHCQCIVLLETHLDIHW